MGTDKNYKIVPMGYGGMVNHTNDRTLQNVQLTRIRGLKKRSEHSSEVVYELIKDIEPGKELLGYYGDEMNAEIEKNVTNVSFAEETQADWAKFLSYGLYHLQYLEEVL